MASILYTLKSSKPSIITADATETEEHTHTATISRHPVDKGADIADNVRTEPDRVSLTLWFSNTPLGPPKQDDYYFTGATWSKNNVDLHVSGNTRLPRRHSGNPINVVPYVPPHSLRDTTGGATQALNLLPGGLGVIGFAANIKTPAIAPVFKEQPVTYEGPGDLQAILYSWSKAKDGSELKTLDRAKVIHDVLRLIQTSGTVCQVVTFDNIYDDMLITSIVRTVDVNTANVAKVVVEFEKIRVVSSETVASTQPLQTRGAQKKNLGPKPTTEETPVQVEKKKSTWRVMQGAAEDAAERAAS